MQLDLSPEERDLLIRLVESALGEARVEVRHTQIAQYRERVRGEETQLKELLERLRAAAL